MVAYAPVVGWVAPDFQYLMTGLWACRTARSGSGFCAGSTAGGWRAPFRIEHHGLTQPQRGPADFEQCRRPGPPGAREDLPSHARPALLKISVYDSMNPKTTPAP